MRVAEELEVDWDCRLVILVAMDMARETTEEVICMVAFREVIMITEDMVVVIDTTEITAMEITRVEAITDMEII